ncbi:MAG: tRNA preQ1(34) S-adenosylmethionine ribosyltransferase-isomerase QueA [Acidobacteriota bacterium]
MFTSDFDYDLPADRIAQHPVPRGTSRLLRVDADGTCRDRSIDHLADLLRTGDLLVLNNTRVLPARLTARRESTEGALEILLLVERSAAEWEVLLRPARRARPGQLYRLSDELSAVILERAEGGRAVVRFSEPIEPHLDRLGHIPLPPYIHRLDTDSDRTDYQTVYASRPGAIAAPTAGLHLTQDLLSRIRSSGVNIAELTLHVGIGTFKPVDAVEIQNHRMESERFELPEDTVAAIRDTRDRGGRIVAVGTTVVRALESSALLHGEPLHPGPATTSLFITPGFEFRLVDVLLTNFHLPRSTLLMLVCAFAGTERILRAYEEAIRLGYRFYSYGDAMLVERMRE